MRDLGSLKGDNSRGRGGMLGAFSIEGKNASLTVIDDGGRDRARDNRNGIDIEEEYNAIMLISTGKRQLKALSDLNDRIISLCVMRNSGQCSLVADRRSSLNSTLRKEKREWNNYRAALAKQ